MSNRSFLGVQRNHVIGHFFPIFLYLLSGFCVSAASLKEPVNVAGKSYLIELPSGLCEASKTKWGIEYKKYLLELGFAAGGQPEIVSLIANCDHVAPARRNICRVPGATSLSIRTLGHIGLAKSRSTKG